MMSLLIVILSWLFITSTAEANLYAVVSLAGENRLALYELESESASISLIDHIQTPGSPGAICSYKDSLFVAMKGTKSIASLKLNAEKQLTLLNSVSVGADGSYVSVHPTGKYLYSSSYSAGQVSVFAIDEHGQLSEQPIQNIKTDERAHAAVLDHSGHFLFVPHTRPNRISQFIVDQQTGTLTSNDPKFLQRNPDTGPRHLWFHPDMNYAYGSDEQGNSISLYQFDQSNGWLTHLQTVSSLPKQGYSGRNTTSDIEVHPSGKFVYIANRGHDSIASYHINPKNGRLSPLAHTPTESITRSFNISPDGRLFIAAGQKSGKLAVYLIQKNGVLTQTRTIEIGQRPWWVHIIQN